MPRIIFVSTLVLFSQFAVSQYILFEALETAHNQTDRITTKSDSIVGKYAHVSKYQGGKFYFDFLLKPIGKKSSRYRNTVSYTNYSDSTRFHSAKEYHKRNSWPSYLFNDISENQFFITLMSHYVYGGCKFLGIHIDLSGPQNNKSYFAIRFSENIRRNEEFNIQFQYAGNTGNYNILTNDQPNLRGAEKLDEIRLDSLTRNVSYSEHFVGNDSNQNHNWLIFLIDRDLNNDNWGTPFLVVTTPKNWFAVGSGPTTY